MTEHDQTYRLLKVGETIQEGDEVFERSERWRRAKSVGSTYGEFFLPHRRVLSNSPQPPATDAAPLAALAMREACATVTEWTAWGERHNLTEATRRAIRSIDIPDEAALTAAAMTLPKIKALVDASNKLSHAVLGETGFANAVRLNSGLAYPWPALDAAEELVVAALAALSTASKGSPE